MGRESLVSKQLVNRCCTWLRRIGVRPDTPPELATRIVTANAAFVLGAAAALAICTIGGMKGLHASSMAGATLPLLMGVGLIAMSRGHHLFARVWLTVAASATTLLVARVADPALVIAVPFILAVLPSLVLLPAERIALGVSGLAASVAAAGVFWSSVDLSSPAALLEAITCTSAFGVLQALQWTSARARDADFQALRAAKQRADDAAEARSQFLANMSHELRTPLGAVIGYGDLLVNPSLGFEERRDIVSVLRRNATHLIEVVNQVLDLSKIEAGQLLVDRQPVSLAQIVEDVASVMRVQAAKNQLELRVEYASWLPVTIESDPFRIRQILINLVGNAVKFSQRGSVILRASIDEGAPLPLQLDVVDTGVGIAPDRIERLFEPFTQEDASTQRKHGGTGLGLAISRRLARLLGGELEAQSEPGHGSTFSLRLPATREELRVTSDPSAHVRASSGPEARAQVRLDGVRILLAEDFVDAARLLRLHLEGRGASVVCVGDGSIAVERISAAAGSSDRFHIALMDMQMPTMDGYEATRTLRAAGHGLPIVALTAHAMSGDREKCVAAGCSGYVTKPVEIDLLAAEIRRLLPAKEQGAAAAAPEGDELGAALEQLSKQFEGELPDALGTIRLSVQRGELDCARRVAHKLAGGAGMFGHADVGTAARALEQAICTDQAHHVIDEALGQLERSIPRALAR